MNCQIKSLFPLPSCQKIVALAAVSFCLLGAGRAQAQVIDYYNFNNAQASGSTAGTPVTHASGSGSFGPSNSAITYNFPGTNVVYFGGTTLNAQANDPAIVSGTNNNNALSVQGGGSSSTSATNNGDYITLQTSSTGYSNLNLSYETEGSSTGFTSDQLSYSTTTNSVDSSSFTSFGPPYKPSLSSGSSPPGYMLQSYDLSSITALNNQANIYFRITFTGATAYNGSNRIDNLTLSSTPAPPGIVSAGIGFAVTGFGALLRRRKQSKSLDTATPEAAA